MAQSSHTLLSRLSRWSAELLLVFLGAYAAFWLTNYQQHRESERRHQQILAALEDYVRDIVDSAKTEGEREDRRVANFRGALNAGEMPSLVPLSMLSDYNPGDIANLLQAGGFELLDIQTITALRKAESTLRLALGKAANNQKFSENLIVPNLGKDRNFFYDPATKQLEALFASYPNMLQSTVDSIHNVEKAYAELLTQIQAERHRHR